MALNWNLLERIKGLFSRVESHEDIILEHQLVDLFTQIRKWEETHAPRLSNSFNDRVYETLKSVEIDHPSWRERVVPFLLENRPVQYGLSVAMASILAVVLISQNRGNGPSNQIVESAGVIIDNTQYLDRPSSVEYADTYHRRMFLESVKRDPNLIDTLSKLEAYYLSTGKKSLATEIRGFMEEVQR